MTIIYCKINVLSKNNAFRVNLLILFQKKWSISTPFLYENSTDVFTPDAITFMAEKFMSLGVVGRGPGSRNYLKNLEICPE